MKPTLLTLFLTISFWAMFISSCVTAPQRDFSDADLFLSNSNLPKGWEVAGRFPKVTDNEGQKSGGVVSFYALDTVYDARITQRIYRYDSDGTAGRHYARFETGMFSDESVYRTTPWITPEEFTFSSQAAKQWRFACAGSNFTIGPSTGTYSTICRYLAQYDEFLVIIYVDLEIDNEVFISVPEIATVILSADQQMYNYLILQATPTLEAP